MKTVRSIIGDHPLLRSMEPGHLEVIAQSGQEMFYKSGQMIFRQGEPADRLFLILEGQVALELSNGAGQDRTVQILVAGDVLGWSWLFQPFIWHFQARALGKTRVICFSGAHLLIACERDHDLGYDLMKRISQVLIQRLQATRKLYMEAEARATTALQCTSQARGV